eukprot:TRINITY_DN345_c0_g1_i1.p1 TRINITY_DN345_c0_g1~~TRINITY_DN345_c0_g1_i1.p1  ORF type:complete len:743 (+),score=146.71 TRINITY_DN345_c0_g1_i1:5311-7539(+)
MQFSEMLITLFQTEAMHVQRLDEDTNEATVFTQELPDIVQKEQVPAPATLSKENSEEGVMVPEPVYLPPEEPQPEPEAEEEHKEVSSKKGSENTLPQALVEHTQNVLDQVRSLLGTFPLDAKVLFYNEIAKYDQMVVALQLEQQTLLVQKEDIEVELRNRVMETESLGKLLADAIKEDRYSEAEILQQRLNAVSETVNQINQEFEKLTERLSSNENRKIDLYKDKEKLVSSFNEILQTWMVFLFHLYLSQQDIEKEELKKYSLEETRRIEEANRKLEMEKENYALLSKKINEGKARLDTKSKELEDTIATVCEKWIKEKSRLEEDIKTIDDEISELERKILEKKQERLTAENARQEIVDEINSIRGNYKDREDEITDLNQQINANEQDSAETKQAIEETEQSIKTAEDSLKEHAETKSQLLTTVGEIRDNSMKEQEDLRGQIWIREKLREEIQKFEKELQVGKSKIAELEQNKAQVQEKLAKGESQIKETVAKIMNNKVVLNQMEDEKKAFAAARKFKEASKVSSDIKTLHKEVEASETEVENLKKSKEEYENELSTINTAIQDLKKEVENTEKELNKNLYREVKERLKGVEQLGKSASEDAATTLERQKTMLRDELKKMRDKYAYLEECDYESLDSTKMKEMIEEMKVEASKLEAEIEELSQKEDYEAADSKQQALDSLKERIEKMGKLFQNYFNIYLVLSIKMHVLSKTSLFILKVIRQHADPISSIQYQIVRVFVWIYH